MRLYCVVVDEKLKGVDVKVFDSKEKAISKAINIAYERRVFDKPVYLKPNEDNGVCCFFANIQLGTIYVYLRELNS